MDSGTICLEYVHQAYDRPPRIFWRFVEFPAANILNRSELQMRVGQRTIFQVELGQSKACFIQAARTDYQSRMMEVRPRINILVVPVVLFVGNAEPLPFAMKHIEAYDYFNDQDFSRKVKLDDLGKEAAWCVKTWQWFEVEP
ncbi:TPA: hypothetical protein DF272_02175 [Candidatus Falkowbacteria bacterium]|nr:hypothetical protein [Candidatus Falkowbacteria bacterium]